MNQPAKSRTQPPSTESADPAAPEWGLDVSGKKRVSETRIGVLLVICLVGALGYLTWKKLEERRHKPRGSDFHTPTTAADPDGGGEPFPAGERNELNAGQEPGWAAGLEDEPAFVDDSGVQTVTSGSPDSLSSPPAQQEPEAPASRIVGNDQSLEFLIDRTTRDHQPQPEAQPLASKAEWNPFAADAPLEASQPDLATDSQQANADWTGNQEEWPADRVASAASETDTSRESREPTYAAESPTNEFAPESVIDLFGDGSQPDEEAEMGDDTIIVESTDGPLLEPLPVPADDARVIPVATDGNHGDFTQRAAAETSGGDPWESATPRELAQNGSPSAVEFDFGDTSSNPAAATTASSSSDPGFLPESGHSTTSLGARDNASTVTSASTTAGSDPFFQAAANDSTSNGGSSGIAVHLVRSGDNFWTIAHKHYRAGRYANALAAFNQSRIPDPRKMRPGMKVLIPDRQVLEQQFPKLTGAAYGPGPAAGAARSGFFVDRNGQPAYRVGKNDTLTGIAARHLGRSGRWVQVLGMNHDQLKDANSLKIGMVLKLPLDATQVSVVAETAIAR
jgi:nucleoid-associated protein YgaU